MLQPPQLFAVKYLIKKSYEANYCIYNKERRKKNNMQVLEQSPAW